jgi:hypothetical protein
MAADLKEMLSADFVKNLKNLYEGNSIQSYRLYQPTARDRQEMGAMIDESDEAERQPANRHLPQPEDSENISPEDMEEIEAALEAVKKGKWDEFVAARPYINGKQNPPVQEIFEPERKSTAMLDWEENPPGFNVLFSEGDLEESRTRKSTSELDREEKVYPDDLDPFWQAVEDDWFPGAKKFWSTPFDKEDTAIKNKPQVQPEVKPQPPEPPAGRQPVMSLYDLFGFSEEERKQLNTQKRGKRKPVPKQGQPVQLNLFSQQTNTKPKEDAPATPQPDETTLTQYQNLKEKHPDALLLLREDNNYKAFGKDAKRATQILGTTLVRTNGTDETGFPYNALDTHLPQLVRAGQRVAIADALETPKTEKKQEVAGNKQTNFGYPVFDARKEELDRQRRELQEPRPYSGILQEHHKQGSLVTEQNGQIGFFQERYRDDAVFKSLELNHIQTQKAKLYIEIRDTYHSLYNYEAKEQKENADLRQSLNIHYDTFVKRFRQTLWKPER